MKQFIIGLAALIIVSVVAGTVVLAVSVPWAVHFASYDGYIDSLEDILDAYHDYAMEGDPTAIQVCREAWLALNYDPDAMPFPDITADSEMDGASFLKIVTRKADGGDVFFQAILGSFYNNGQIVELNETTGFGWYLESAEGGYARAQLVTGACYANGVGTATNSSESISWYTRAAEQNMVAAQTLLGQFYFNGIGVESDDETAALWFTKAAEAGDGSAQFALSRMYYSGRHFSDNSDLAVEWCRKAAEQGVVDAQAALGWYYVIGYGVLEDPDMALSWLNRAIDGGSARAQNDLGYMYEFGMGVEIDMERAAGLYEEAAKRGLVGAMVNLAACLADGRGVPQNAVLSAVWYKKAADMGSVTAKGMLGVAYCMGTGVPKNYAKALILLQQAAGSGDSTAQNTLGYMYEMGLGVRRNFKQAAKFYQLAAIKRHPAAMENIARMYESGRGMPADRATARMWTQLLAEQGVARAQFNMGISFHHGHGGRRDAKKAIEWYQKAADQGHASAAYNIAYIYNYGRGVKADRAKALPYYRQAAELGNSSAMLQYGRYLETGEGGVVQDFDAAERWMMASQSAGNHYAADYLKWMRQSRDANDIRQGNPYEKDLLAHNLDPSSKGATKFIFDQAFSPRLEESYEDVLKTDQLLRASLKTLLREKGDDALATALQAVPLCDGRGELPAVAMDVLYQLVEEDDIETLHSALYNEDPLIRAAAVKLLAPMENPLGVEYAALALKDTSEMVRLEAAREIANVGRAEAIPVLVELLNSKDEDIRKGGYWLLRDMTGAKLPYNPIAEPEERAGEMQALVDWVYDEDNELELQYPIHGMSKGNFLDGNKLMALGYKNKVIEVDAQGNAVWEMDVTLARNANKLENGNYMINSNGERRAMEVTKEGEIVWEYEGDFMRVRDLPYGNALLADYENRKIVEVDKRDNSVAWEYEARAHVYDARMLDSGNVLYCTPYSIHEVSKDKKTVWTHDNNGEWGGYRTAQRLDDGNTLVATFRSGVKEIDKEGATVWHFDEELATDAHRLPNGNTLITSVNRSLEVDADGEIVSEEKITRFGSMVQ